MIVEKLKQAVHDRPFQPFASVIGNGSRYRVNHPEMIAIAPKARRTFIIAFWAEEHAVLDLLLVTALESGARRTKNNGRW